MFTLAICSPSLSFFRLILASEGLDLLLKNLELGIVELTSFRLSASNHGHSDFLKIWKESFLVNLKFFSCSREFVFMMLIR